MSITLDQFRMAIEQLPRESLQAELDHLMNAHRHLLSSYTDLFVEFTKAQDQQTADEFALYIRENFDAMQRQRDKMVMLVERLLDNGPPTKESMGSSGSITKGFSVVGEQSRQIELLQTAALQLQREFEQTAGGKWM